MKWVPKILVRLLLGGIAILLLNLLGSGIKFHIGLNVISALTAGLLGIPGILLLAVLTYFY